MIRLKLLAVIGLAATATIVAKGDEVVDMGNGYRQANDIAYYDAAMPRQGDSGYIDERCKLDVYYPAEAKDATTVLYIHGGGLSTGEKFIPEPLRNSGLIVVAPNYRLSSERARCPDYLYDAAAATAWVFRHIAEYGGNPELVFITGGSGGGYLSAMIGMDARWLEAFGESNLLLAGIMPISGQMTTHFQLLNERNGTAGMTQPARAVIDEYAPLYHAKRELPPIVLYAGDPKIEWPTRAEENMLLAATLTRVAGHTDTTIHILSGFDHGDVYDPSYLLMKKRIPLICGEKLRPLLKPQPIGLTGETGWLPMQSRRGGEVSDGSRVGLRLDGGELVIEADCRGAETEALVEGAFGWDGDCVEIFLGNPEAGQVGQWVVTPGGKLYYFSALGLAEVPARAEAVRTEAGWQVEFAVPFDRLPAGSRVNVIRHHVGGGSDFYTNLSPVYGALNAEAAAMVELRR